MVYGLFTLISTGSLKEATKTEWDTKNLDDAVGRILFHGMMKE